MPTTTTTTAPQPLDLAALARGVNHLPALPEVVLELLQVLRRDDLSAQRCITLIERDPALAGRTLRLANSAFYGVSGRVGSVGDAVRLLGLRTVAGVLAAVSLQATPGLQGCAGFSLRRHWQLAITTALAARCLAAAAGLDPEQAFLAGLLQDSGQLVLATLAPLHAAHVLAQALASGQTLETVEQALLGVAHPQLGALLAHHWHLPETIAQAIAQHHAPLRDAAPGTAQDTPSLADVLQAGDALVQALQQAPDTDAALATWLAAPLPARPHDPATARQVLVAVDQGSREFAAVLQPG